MSDAMDPRPMRDARWMVHLVLTVIMGAMAIQLWLPGDTFGAGQGGPAAGNWRLVSAYLSEKSTASALFAVACVGAVGMTTDSRTARFVSVVVLCVAHGMLAGAFVWSNPNGVGAILLTGYAALGLYLTYRRMAEGIR